jgi:hypothetical protein
MTYLEEEIWRRLKRRLSKSGWREGRELASWRRLAEQSAAFGGV